MDDENYQWPIDIAATDDEKDKVSIEKIMKKLNSVQIVPEKSSEISSEKLSDLDGCIREVPKHLRDVNKDAYEPQIIAIGPYHRGKKHLQVMEEEKLRCLKKLLQQRKEHDVRCYMKAMRTLKNKALACYADYKSNLSQNDEFVEMMLLDACFIVQLLRNYWQKLKYNEPLYDSRLMEQKLRRDLLLAENQIPFFVLDEFFKMTDKKEQDDGRNHFLTMICSFFFSLVPNQCNGRDAKESLSVSVLPKQCYGQDAKEAGCHVVPTTGSYPFLHSERFQNSNAIKHLLSFVHDGWECCSFPKTKETNGSDKAKQPHQFVGKSTNSGTEKNGLHEAEQPHQAPNSGTRNCNWKIFSFPKSRAESGSDNAEQPLRESANSGTAMNGSDEAEQPHQAPNSGTRNWSWKIFSFPKTKEKKGSDKAEQPPRRCATKLKEVGIKFKELKSRNLFDIKFEHGIMKIPRLKIDDGTESFFQNLIFYEHWFTKKPNPVIDYINFMDSLINSEKDVELLCKHKIIDNFLGDDEVVAKTFNKLGDSITFSFRDHYGEIYDKLNTHYCRRRNKWMANLWHNHCNTPWAVFSVAAAVSLLFLTLLQTVYSVLAYYKK